MKNYPNKENILKRYEELKATRYWKQTLVMEVYWAHLRYKETWVTLSNAWSYVINILINQDLVYDFVTEWKRTDLTDYYRTSVYAGD